MSIEQAGYAVWRKDKPSNDQRDDPDYKGARQVCGTMDREGQYSNCWCQMQHGYICEQQATVVARPQEYTIHGESSAKGFFITVASNYSNSDITLAVN